MDQEKKEFGKYRWKKKEQREQTFGEKKKSGEKIPPDPYRSSDPVFVDSGSFASFVYQKSQRNRQYVIRLRSS